LALSLTVSDRPDQIQRDDDPRADPAEPSFILALTFELPEVFQDRRKHLPVLLASLSVKARFLLIVMTQYVGGVLQGLSMSSGIVSESE
jgi:hypothetical protein